MKPIQTVLLMLALCGIFAGCGKTEMLPQQLSSSDPTSDILSGKILPAEFVTPENFVEEIDNLYFGIAEEGDTLFYETTVDEDGEIITEQSYITVTDEEKVIAGVDITVVHDAVFVDGELVEDTKDWYAQDIHGNVWYLGEDTKKYFPDGTYSTEGSFEHGIDGASGGIIMVANPALQFGKVYSQENYPGHAEDMAKIVGLDETVTIGLGTYYHCLKTLEASPLEPDVVNSKYYAPGIGQVYSEKVTGGIESSELTGISD